MPRQRHTRRLLLTAERVQSPASPWSHGQHGQPLSALVRVESVAESFDVGSIVSIPNSELAGLNKHVET
jgi:hypothetical protein